MNNEEFARIYQEKTPNIKTTQAPMIQKKLSFNLTKKKGPIINLSDAFNEIDYQNHFLDDSFIKINKSPSTIQSFQTEKNENDFTVNSETIQQELLTLNANLKKTLDYFKSSHEELKETVSNIKEINLSLINSLKISQEAIIHKLDQINERFDLLFNKSEDF